MLHGAIEEIRFGTFVTVGRSGPIATHVPMYVVAEPGSAGTIYGHIARQNPQWSDSNLDLDAAALFVGPHAYISPSWYETKSVTGKVVPTWNYVAVQARGLVEFFDDPDRLRAVVERLTGAEESQRERPWAVSDAPSEYIDQMLRAIVGFKLAIRQIDGAWKLGQNRNEADRRGMIAGLESSCDPAQREVARIAKAVQ